MHQSTIVQKRWKSVLSYIGTTHNCSKYIYRSKNVLVPKWAKKRSGWGIQMQAVVVIETPKDRKMLKQDERSTAHATAPESLHHIHPTHKHKREEPQKVSRHRRASSSSGSFSALFMALW